MGGTQPKIHNSLIGAAGVHFVVSELNLRGIIALPTVKNTAGIDIVVASTDGSRHANLQVKTSGKKASFWPVSQTYKNFRGKNSYYVFVRYLKLEHRFEVFLETAERAAKQLAAYVRQMRRHRYAEFTPSWYLPSDEKNFLRVKTQWEEFKRGCFP